MDYLEIVAACDLEVGCYSKLNESIRVFLDSGLRVSDSQITVWDSQIIIM